MHHHMADEDHAVHTVRLLHVPLLLDYSTPIDCLDQSPDRTALRRTIVRTLFGYTLQYICREQKNNDILIRDTRRV